MIVKPIKTERDYQKALERLRQIFDAKPGTKLGKELDMLVGLIEKYEDEHYPLEPPSKLST